MKTIHTITYALLCAGAITLFMGFTGRSAKANANPAAITVSSTLPNAGIAEDETGPECTVPATPAAITGSSIAIFCPKTVGGTIYSIVPVAGATSYVWTVSGGSIISTNLSKTSVTVKWGPYAKSISVKAANSCGSSGTRTLVITSVIKFCSSS